MVRPLLKVGRFALKTIGKPFSTGIRKESNDRITKTMQHGHVESGTLNKDTAGPDVTVGGVVVFSVGVASLLVSAKRYFRVKAEIAEREEILAQEWEAMNRDSEAKRQKFAEWAARRLP